MLEEFSEESIFISITSSDELHLKRFYSKNKLGPPVLMLHGSIENGRIFYSKNKKGLAPYLAQNGFDVYVADLRGRGESRPLVHRGSRYGQTEAITEDIPAFINKICQIRGNIPQHWIAHSWGGVLFASYLARFKEHRDLVHSMVFFGTKRSISVTHLKKLIMMDLFWGPVARFLVKCFGYLPIKQLGLSSDNETDRFHKHILLWATHPSAWVGPDDKFDYAKAVQKITLPPTLYFAGIADSYLGHPKDVHRFLKETGAQNAEYRLLSKANGNLQDYDHIDMLTHPDATRDHFPQILQWLRAT